MLLHSLVRTFERLTLSTAPLFMNRNASLAFRFHRKFIHLSPKRCNSNLMDFFDTKSNWGKDEVKCGRSWKLDELRNKSNQDLHKLWYILLKEKNMLLTMEEFCKEQYVLFPSPERIDKVEGSMKNLETVVRERNKAYFLLETGEDGERPAVTVHSAIGLPVFHRQTQHTVPKVTNTWWKKTFQHHYDAEECRKFLLLYREKKSKRNFKLKMRRASYAKNVLKRFKNVDVKYLKEVYPELKVSSDEELPESIGGH